MHTIYFWVISAILCASAAQAEIWETRSLGPSGEARERRWEIRQTGDSTEYFLQGQSRPMYTLVKTGGGARVELANGMARYFSPGFLLLVDLPLPVVVLDKVSFGDNRHCFQEYIGDTAFQVCMNVTMVEFSDQVQGTPFQQSGEIFLIFKDGGVDAVIGPDFQAKRVEK